MCIRDSTYAELAEQYGATVTGVDDLNQTFELLLSGRIDATLNAEMCIRDRVCTSQDDFVFIVRRAAAVCNVE